jgi:lantibiotic modifying enzyme
MFVINGFTSLYWFIKDNSEELIRIIHAQIADDFRVRFLVRKTKHYIAVMEMINLPQVDFKKHLSTIHTKFSNSGSFHEVSSELLAAEWADMLDGDVPYFWVRAGDTSIYNRSGVIERNALQYKVIDKIDTLFSSMNQVNFELELEILSEFLEANFNEPRSNDSEHKKNGDFAFNGVEHGS